MKKIVFLIILVPLWAFLSYQLIESKMYSWQTPKQEVKKTLRTSTLFEGAAFDMEYIHMSANSLFTSKAPLKMKAARNEENLLLVKSGTLTIRINDSTWSIGSGSIALVLPDEKFFLQNQSKDSCTFYLMKYRSKLPVDVIRGKTSGGSLVRDWNKIAFQPHDRGGIRKYFERPTAMCKRFEMHVTTLNEGIKSHEPHTHRAEEIVLIINNNTEMQIGEKFFKGAEGDIYYLGSNVPHAIRNDGKGTCTYFAFQFE